MRYAASQALQSTIKRNHVISEKKNTRDMRFHAELEVLFRN